MTYDHQHQFQGEGFPKIPLGTTHLFLHEQFHLQVNDSQHIEGFSMITFITLLCVFIIS